MPIHLTSPVTIAAAGEPPKQIDEYTGRLSTGDPRLSIAWMRSPAGWDEPPQVPEFDEWTVVMSGSLHVEHDDGTIVVEAGQGIAVAAGERVRYSTPRGAEYLAVCLPAFSADTVHRAVSNP